MLSIICLQCCEHASVLWSVGHSQRTSAHVCCLVLLVLACLFLLLCVSCVVVCCGVLCVCVKALQHINDVLRFSQVFIVFRNYLISLHVIKSTKLREFSNFNYWSNFSKNTATSCQILRNLVKNQEKIQQISTKKLRLEN